MLSVGLLAFAMWAPTAARFTGVAWIRASDEASSPEPSDTSGFPWADDYRNPNKAWGAGAKIAFLCIYGAFWAMVTLLVYQRARLSSFVSRIRRRRAPQALAAAPLLEESAGETNVGPTPSYPSEQRLAELFEFCVERNPSHAALVLPKSGASPRLVISYKELSALFEELAAGLNTIGITNGSIVALTLQRTIAQVVAVWGTLKAGAAFLPIDVEAPEARKILFVQESEARAVVAERGDATACAIAQEVGTAFISLGTDGALGGIEISGGRHSPVARRRPQASDCAMLIYTSGTTGAPKGIIYDHQHLLHGAWFFAERCDVGPNSVALLKASYFWAVIEYEIFPVLIKGASLVVASPNGHKSPEYLVQTIRDEQVSALMITPQVLELLIDTPESRGGGQPLRSLTHICLAGEALSTALANRLVRTRGLTAEIHNFYGASESSCTVYTVPRGGVDLERFPTKAPAGLPQEHATVYVMRAEGGTADDELRLVPVPTGEAGEICFGGISAAGYWRRNELTNEKWVTIQPYGRLYRTGDLGRWQGGVLEVLGRLDRQVKVRGVRVEPEEIEVVLKNFGTEGGDTGGQGAVTRVAVVASAEPCELVAFVTPRAGAADIVTQRTLKEHCEANLTPAYVPKFIVVVPEGLPQLPNGKVNLAELKERATAHVDTEGEMVMDSLGQMRKLSQWAIFENAVIHRCYSFWMLGVLLDHWCRCAIDSDSNGQLIPFCSTLAMSAVPPWAEAMLRSFGNDQDLFGFILLGAYQDSRPPGPRRKPRVNFGLKDLFIFAVYLLMALPFAQMMHYVFGSLAWPKHWDGVPDNNWDYTFMRVNSFTSDHRWYLIMVLEARVFLAVGEKLRVPGWLQTVVAVIPCFLPNAAWEEQEYLWDFCESGTAPQPIRYILSWVFRNFGEGCPLVWRWMMWYWAFYIFAFHYIRHIVDFVTPRLPKGATWGAAAFGGSMMIGVLMALFHYPNQALETGTGIQWVWLELLQDFFQPTLLALGMSQLPFNMTFWGNTTLGTYCFHFYFKDEMARVIQALCLALSWDPTGIIQVLGVLFVGIIFTTVFGPIGHYFLLSPTFIWARVKRMMSSRRAAETTAVRTVIPRAVSMQGRRMEGSTADSVQKPIHSGTAG